MAEPLEPHESLTTRVDTWVGEIPVTREAEAGGLRLVMQITPGPYFLGELLAVNLSLHNASGATYTLAGPAQAGPCGSAVFVTMRGGSEPQSEPEYVLPVATAHSCPPMRTTLAPGDTLTLHEFLPVSHTGQVILEVGARFLTDRFVGRDGISRVTTGPSPLDGWWPSITLAVAAATPSDRLITLQREGTQVQVSVPPAALAHLHYLYEVTCHAFQGGLVHTGNFMWKPIATTSVQEPTCGDYGRQVIRWSYAVSAPGYAIAVGHVSV